MNPKVKELPNKKCLTNSEAKRSVYQKGLSSTTNNYQLAKMPNQNILCNFLLNLLHSTSRDQNSVICNTAILVAPQVQIA